MDLLHKQGKKFGLTDPEIDILLKGIKNNEPEELKDF
jgi:hypothetical protein